MKNVSPGWAKISSGHQDEAILAVDFDVTGRLEASFRDLVRLLPGDLEVWQTSPPPKSYRASLPATDYLDWWRNYPVPADRPIGVVLGYCVGSVFASVLADEIEHAQGKRPRLVLFDPESPNTLSLYRDFRKVTEMMSVLTDEEKHELHDEAQRVQRESGDDFDTVSEKLVAMYEHAGSTAFARLGLDEDLGEELIGLFRSYVSYLAAARQLDPKAGWATATAITSAASSGGAKYTAKEISFQLGHEELLRGEDVAPTAYRLISGEDS